MAANGGSPVAVYSPGTFNDGSSIGHITAAGAVMNFSVASGVEKREYLAIELGINNATIARYCQNNRFPRVFVLALQGLTNINEAK